ncbi:hypothetical protein NCAS_0B00460 [Naumovozyma castellii]|uniref:Uncharacterized protein n=1 Tax=Naumovozyma castellii TaxID=27288 RepID=G0VB07_NAUCA|nr:hypothetical protein NCAS_0B00460 [Naumovozyma castellii CBS 4309]CCC68130.1 hypothetical protein NCAS_0B00460 [Naumovozyma castellii CBS 4309]
MVRLSNSVATLAALATSTNALTTLSPSDETVNLIELAVYVNDIKANLNDYFAMAAAHPEQAYPDIIASAVFGDADFTTMLTGIEPAEVTSMLTGVAWYSSRIAPAIEASLSARGIVTAVAEAPAASSAAPAASSAAPAASSAAPAASSAAPAASSAAPAASSAAPAASSAATAPVFVNGTSVASNVTTAYETSIFYNTATVTNCSSSAVVDVTKTALSTTLETITSCDEVCVKSKSSAAAASTKTATALTTTLETITSCDEGCVRSKSSAAKTSTYAITAQTANGAAKQYAGLGAGIVGAAGLLLL